MKRHQTFASAVQGAMVAGRCGEAGDYGKRRISVLGWINGKSVGNYGSMYAMSVCCEDVDATTW